MGPKLKQLIAARRRRAGKPKQLLKAIGICIFVVVSISLGTTMIVSTSLREGDKGEALLPHIKSRGGRRYARYKGDEMQQYIRKVEDALGAIQQQSKLNQGRPGEAVAARKGISEVLKTLSEKSSKSDRGTHPSRRSSSFLNRKLPASMCVSKLPGGTCQVQPCSNMGNNSTSLQPHYGHGFLKRHPSIRQTVMRLGGSARSGSGCAISHKYKFLYVHVLKSGGMTLKTFLKNGLCHNSTNMPCKGGADKLEIVTCKTALQQNPDYFVWSFVRNPFSRMYSAYAMALDYNTRRKSEKTLPPFEFEKYVLIKRNTHAKKTANKVRRRLGERGAKDHQRSAMERLQELHELHRRRHSSKSARRNPRAGRGSSTNQCLARKALTYMDPVHCHPQHYFLFDSNLCPVFDFVGRLENFAEDLKTVVDIIGSPELYKQYQIWLAASKNTTAVMHKEKSTSFGSQQKQAMLGGNLQRAYKEELRQAVATEYALDFELLGYDKNVIPQ